MTKRELLDALTEVLQLEEAVEPAAALDNLEEWDSLARMGVISLFDMEFDIHVTAEELAKAVTVDDLLSLAGILTEG